MQLWPLALDSATVSRSFVLIYWPKKFHGQKTSECKITVRVPKYIWLNCLSNLITRLQMWVYFASATTEISGHCCMQTSRLFPVLSFLATSDSSEPELAVEYTTILHFDWGAVKAYPGLDILKTWEWVNFICWTACDFNAGHKGFSVFQRQHTHTKWTPRLGSGVCVALEGGLRDKGRTFLHFQN